MAKKKKAIDLTQHKLSFTQNNTEYRLLRFKPESMTIDVIEYRENQKRALEIPFAHLPKKLKKIVKPN